MVDILYELCMLLVIVCGEFEVMCDGVCLFDVKGLQLLYEEVMWLDWLVDDLYQWLMVDVGLFSYCVQFLDLLVCFVEGCVWFVSVVVEVGFMLDCSGELLCVYGDVDCLCQLIDNLFGNSLCYSDCGGCVEVCVFVDGDQVCLCVDDMLFGVVVEDLV